MKKNILFLSIMDFTDQGIQVVKLTPQFFVKKGWNVEYLVTRDYSKNGSYFYQDIINPEGVNVNRFKMPQLIWAENFTNHIFKTSYSKIRGYLSILKLAWFGYKIVKQKEIDIIYGGGPHGVLAAHLINLFLSNKRKVVARYYGVWNLYSDYLINKNIKKLVLNWDILLSLRLKSHLIIVTNDGTYGNKAAELINKKNKENIRFYVNGTDKIRKNGEPNILHSYNVSRLVQGKRVDRIIKIISVLVTKYGAKNFKHHIIGDGEDSSRLKELSEKLNLQNNIIFHGSKKNLDLHNITNQCAICFSTFDVSNVGNPLLEAIRSNKIIFTLNNGDTSSWIRHKSNGFIYHINESLYDTIAKDVIDLIDNKSLQDKIMKNIKLTENEKLWTWDERLEEEHIELTRLLET